MKSEDHQSRFIKGPFFGEEHGEVPYAEAKVAILPCPFDGTSTYGKGADKGPASLLDATVQLELYDMELDRFPYTVGVTTLPEVKFQSDDPELAVKRIEKAADKAVHDGKFLFGIGGEHTVTVGLTRALRRAQGSFSVLQIDAHADLRSEYEGSPYNHACVMHRLAEDDRSSTIVAVGIRACTKEEVDYARHRGIHTFAGHQLAGHKDWIEDAVALLKDPVYVTVDLDGLDPSILPSTGTPVPGGLTWQQTLKLLRRVGETHVVASADITELKPDPVNHHSQFLAAQLLYKMIAYFTSP